jgi:hypothetical protein
LIRDLATLNGCEVLPWDVWGAQPPPDAELSAVELVCEMLFQTADMPLSSLRIEGKRRPRRVQCNAVPSVGTGHRLTVGFHPYSPQTAGVKIGNRVVGLVDRIDGVDRDPAVPGRETTFRHVLPRFGDKHGLASAKRTMSDGEGTVAAGRGMSATQGAPA